MLSSSQSPKGPVSGLKALEASQHVISGNSDLGATRGRPSAFIVLHWSTLLIRGNIGNWGHKTISNFSAFSLLFLINLCLFWKITSALDLGVSGIEIKEHCFSVCLTMRHQSVWPCASTRGGPYMRRWLLFMAAAEPLCVAWWTFF